MVSGKKVEPVYRPIRLGMVGGGQGAFIGGVHRIAARLDNEFVLVAGALSSNPQRARASAAELGLEPERSYASFAEMAKAEAKRLDGIEAVAIVTPNNVHFPAAKAFLEAGIHVICDKPLTATLAEAKKLAALVEKTGKVFVLTHNYTAYPMVRQAREMVAKGQLGDIRIVQVEYPQDWLTMICRPAATSRRHGAPTRNRRARAGRPATSAPTPTTLPVSSAGLNWTALPPIWMPSCRGGSLMTTFRSCCVSRPSARPHRPRACYGQARSRQGMKTD